jgi:hypothetical protein
MIKGAIGGDIEEPDDLDREISLLEKRLNYIGSGVTKPKSREAIVDIFDNSVSSLLIRANSITEKFNKLYKNHSFTFQIKSSNDAYRADFFSLDDIRNRFNAQIAHLKFLFTYKSLKEIQHLKDFNYHSVIEITFQKNTYVVRGTFDDVFEHFYSEYLSEKEVEFILRSIPKKHMTAIEHALGGDNEFEPVIL